MRRRALAVLLPVLLLAAGAWQLRENGILLGRDADGPLQLGFGHGSGPQEPGEIAYLVDIVAGGNGHEIESIEAERASPGLEILEPVVFDRLRSGGITSIAKWPPKRTRPAEGLVLDRDVSIGLGARAKEPGIYHLAGVRFRYREGLRRFDEVDDTALCFHVLVRGENRCPENGRVARAEGMAEIGGPSDYRDGRLLDSWEDFGDDGVLFRMRRGRELRFTITISNLAGEDREVPRLDLGLRGDLNDQLNPLPSKPPAPFTIPAGGSRKVTVRSRYDCGRHVRGNQQQHFEAIEAGDDDIELSMPVRVAAPCR